MYELYTDQEIEKLHQEIVERRMRIIELLKKQAFPIEKTYKFYDQENLPVALADLFGDKDDLILVHNMGKRCVYCTLWADGINGFHQHIQDRTSFVVISPDDPATQKEFATSRGWKFKMLSDKDRTFSIDMGFGKMKDDKYYAMPGYSTFHRETDGTIKRIGYDEFGPGDLYAPIWHMLDLLPAGAAGWEPQYEYTTTPAREVEV